MAPFSGFTPPPSPSCGPLPLKGRGSQEASKELCGGVPFIHQDGNRPIERGQIELRQVVDICDLPPDVGPPQSVLRLFQGDICGI